MKAQEARLVATKVIEDRSEELKPLAEKSAEKILLLVEEAAKNGLFYISYHLQDDFEIKSDRDYKIFYSLVSNILIQSGFKIEVSMNYEHMIVDWESY